MKIIMHDPWGIRGMGVYDYSLCDALHKKVESLSLITNYYYEYERFSNFEVSKIFFKYSENMEDNRYRRFVRGLEYITIMLSLLNRYSKELPDIIHIQWLLNRYRFEYLWLKILRYKLRGRQTKIVLTAHNILPHINGLKYRGALEKVYSQFDGIVVHGEAIKSQMFNVFGAKAKKWKVGIIPHGIEDKVFEKINKKDLNNYRKELRFIKSKEHNFLFAGVIHENKGLDILLASWVEHINKYPYDKLFIIGKATYNISNELRLIKRFHSSIVTSWGYKSDEELLAHYLECDFVVLPYKEASQSGVLLTALTLGKPVIAAKVGGLPEVINKVQGGFTIHPNDPHLLSEALEKAARMSPDDLIKWGHNIKRKTFESYSWENIANQTIGFYEKILN